MDRPAFVHLFTGMPVADYGSSLHWYERLLGRPPDVIVAENEAMWQVVDGGWIYVVGDASRAGQGQLTLFVDDLEKYRSAVTQRGITVEPIHAGDGGVRVVVLADPARNRITIGENPSRDKAE